MRLEKMTRQELAELALQIKCEQKHVTNTQRMRRLIAEYRTVVARICDMDRMEAEIHGGESH